MRAWISPFGAFAFAMLSGCVAPPPTAPSITVLPGTGKSYAAFQEDDYACRTAAAQAIGYSLGVPQQAAAGSALAGTVIGAAAGAALGAASGNAGAGAAIGAGTGLLVGSAAGASNAALADATLQRRYDIAYAQCMATKGNDVPPLPAPATAAYPAPAPGYYPYIGYPPVYAYYPGYGYLYPSVSIIYGWGWDGWHRRGHWR